ncbi:hypothetical protein SAMN05216225_102932 [Ornithinibacillus halophilus]|uniref:Uncharacterized protein n=1 Tax=Ornithinibacillus halophilus TaxID=930117 RepID=A0A1M5JC89_9BACI|nr:hypothetical protein SAMN05216225_102932 [Ornithinibacillus halophilus]
MGDFEAVYIELDKNSRLMASLEFFYCFPVQAIKRLPIKFQLKMVYNKYK